MYIVNCYLPLILVSYKCHIKIYRWIVRIIEFKKKQNSAISLMFWFFICLYYTAFYIFDLSIGIFELSAFYVSLLVNCSSDQ